jgi:hypothetical protein
LQSAHDAFAAAGVAQQKTANSAKIECEKPLKQQSNGCMSGMTNFLAGGEDSPAVVPTIEQGELRQTNEAGR